MKPIVAVTIVMTALVALAGFSIYVAWQLVIAGHGVFAVLAGLFAVAALAGAGEVEVTGK